MLKAFASLLLVAGTFLSPELAQARVDLETCVSQRIYNGTVGILSVVAFHNIDEHSGAPALILLTTRREFEWLKAEARRQSPVVVEVSGSPAQLMLYVDHEKASGHVVSTCQRVYVVPQIEAW